MRASELERVTLWVKHDYVYFSGGGANVINHSASRIDITPKCRVSRDTDTIN